MTDSKVLASLADEYWEARLQAHPVMATAIGDRRFDDRLEDISPEGRAAWHARLMELHDRVGRITTAQLDEEDRITQAALDEVIRTDVAIADADRHAYSVDPLDGPQVGFLNIPAFQSVRTEDEAEDLLARWRAMGPWVDDLIANLRRGASDGRLGVRMLVGCVIEQLEETLARPDAEWPLAAPTRAVPDDWSDADADRFRSGLTDAIAVHIRPAFGRYREFLVNEIQPRARSDEQPGLVHLPGGDATYRSLVRAYTSLPTSPEEIHETGLAEVERIDVELVELGARLLDTDGLAATLDRLRSDPALRFTQGDEVFKVAEGSLWRASAAIDAWLGRLPLAPCEVVRMEPHEEKHSTITYYREPAVDGSRPGQYYINTSEPETRPRYEAEALAFHEAVPGHHLQTAIAQELARLPDFRRFLGTTAYVEGWGLYAERLAVDMGLYSGDLDLFGVASFDAWRACRLVVDTGMHAMGWSRGRAIGFMTEHTGLGANNIANEVDRYIAMPGQALAYKLGQLELLCLREEARSRLGDAFDIRAFHDAVLGEGALPLPVLRRLVERRLA